MPSNRLPYYSYSSKPKSESIQLAAGLLFLYNIGKLKINFEAENNKYIIYEDAMTKFITANNYQNILTSC